MIKKVKGGKVVVNRLCQLLVFSCALLPALVWAEPVELESEMLKVTVLPASSGRVSSLLDKRTGIEHLEPLVEREKSFSPLVPPLVESNQAGAKDWFWQARISPKIPFSIVDRGQDEAEQWVLLQGIVNGVTVQRKIRLLVSEPVLLFEITLTAPSRQTLSYWAHSVTRADAYLSESRHDGMVAGNFSIDDDSRQGRGIVKPDEPGPQLFTTHLSDYAFNPQQPWFARVLTDRSGGLMLVTDATFNADSDRFFYTWQNASTTSLEAVWPPLTLEPDEPVTLRYLFKPFRVDAAEINKIDEIGRNTYQKLYHH